MKPPSFLWVWAIVLPARGLAGHRLAFDQERRHVGYDRSSHSKLQANYHGHRSLVALASCFLSICSPAVGRQAVTTRRVKSRPFSRSADSLGVVMQTSDSDAKKNLFTAIAEFDSATTSDGVPSIDFGVKGGELDGDTRAPRDLYKAGAYHAVSSRVGAAADAVLAAVDAVEAVNPTAKPTRNFGTREGLDCPLHGMWSNIFTTAADAVFSPNSTRGDANVYNNVDGVSGRTTNIIEFLPRDSKSKVDTLRVRLSAKAVSDNRVELIFRWLKIRFRRFLGLPVPFTLIIPVPGPFLTRILFAFRRKKAPPPAYFDILYLDDDLRVHRTGQGNVFIQRRLRSA